MSREAPDVDDNGALSRVRAEAAQPSEAGAADRELADALDLVELCAATAERARLAGIAERLGRAYSRAMARLHAQEREAVRAAVDRS
jgi:hypothetical protein